MPLPDMVLLDQTFTGHPLSMIDDYPKKHKIGLYIGYQSEGIMVSTLCRLIFTIIRSTIFIDKVTMVTKFIIASIIRTTKYVEKLDLRSFEMLSLARIDR